jgi:short-subunit dehydrogenase
MAATGLDTVPDEAFTTTPFATDWLDTAESEQLLHYQRRTLDDYAVDMRRELGWKRPFIRLFRRPIMRSLLRSSPHWNRRQMRQPLAGRGALITGASSGIGAEVARHLARHGAAVALVARRGERLELLADEIRRDGGCAAALVADLTNEDERQQVLREAGKRIGCVDILVNSAGFGWYGYGCEMPWPLAQQMIQTNLVALTHLTLLAMQDMQAQGRGHIVNIGSIVGSLPEQGVAVYSATKSFVDSFTTALYRELRGANVRVTLIRPGPVRTEFYERAAGLDCGGPIPAEMFAIRADDVARQVIAVLKRPRRVAHVPSWLAVAQWVEPCFAWLIDRMGPLLLRRSARPTGS